MSFPQIKYTKTCNNSATNYHSCEKFAILSVIFKLTYANCAVSINCYICKSTKYLICAVVSTQQQHQTGCVSSKKRQQCLLPVCLSAAAWHEFINPCTGVKCCWGSMLISYIQVRIHLYTQSTNLHTDNNWS